MALGQHTIFEVRAAGSDTANGGAFDPGQTAGMFTDGAATSATGNSPVFSSASYNFVAGDVGAKVYIASGTNWTAGWYEIASVASNVATLSAAIGAGILVSGSKPIGATTVAGCATTASPTGATWTIDYSQQNAAQFSYTDLASAGAGLTVSSAAFPFAKQQVGNCLIIASGTNFTAGNYVIASVAAGVATVVGAANITTGAGASGVGGLGGAFATWAKAETKRIASNGCFIKSTSGYTISSGTTLAATGNSLPNVCPDWTIGYTTTRLDGGIVTITASAAISMVTISANNCQIENIVLDGADTATTCWIHALSNAERGLVLTNTGATRFATRGYGLPTNATGGGCLVRPRVWDAKAGATSGIAISYGQIIEPEINCPECDGISNEGANAANVTIIGGIIYMTNVGSAKKALKLDGCLATAIVYGLTLHTSNGDLITLNGTYQSLVALNNIIYGAGGYGINAGYARPMSRSINYNAFGSNTSGNRNNVAPGPNDVTLTGDPCVNVSGGDLSLDNSSGEGAACRAVGSPATFPGGTTTAGRDIGAVQTILPTPAQIAAAMWAYGHRQLTP